MVHTACAWAVLHWQITNLSLWAVHQHAEGAQSLALTADMRGVPVHDHAVPDCPTTSYLIPAERDRGFISWWKDRLYTILYNQKNMFTSCVSNHQHFRSRVRVSGTSSRRDKNRAAQDIVSAWHCNVQIVDSSIGEVFQILDHLVQLGSWIRWTSLVTRTSKHLLIILSNKAVPKKHSCTKSTRSSEKWFHFPNQAVHVIRR